MGAERLQNTFNLGRDGLGNRIRIEKPQPSKHAITYLMGQLKEGPGEIRLRAINRPCRVKRGQDLLSPGRWRTRMPALQGLRPKIGDARRLKAVAPGRPDKCPFWVSDSDKNLPRDGLNI